MDEAGGKDRYRGHSEQPGRGHPLGTDPDQRAASLRAVAQICPRNRKAQSRVLNRA